MQDKLLNYFNGDDLASSVWLGKYAQEGELDERSIDIIPSSL